jgi:D-tyrosyl-tRNA(Tyr) deacylase
MIAVIQRVSKASVTISGTIHSKIDTGLLILIGIEDADEADDIEWLSNKIINLRVFADENNVMNKSLLEADGEVLVVSQFTLHASTKKGNRPSYSKAAKPEIAIPKYEKFLESMRSKSNQKGKSGLFGADMKISLVNDGPVTIIIDTKNKQ